jgi:D-xylose transport system substrate-binding protein
VAVTKDNLDEVIIDGGFHSKEDVYLNISDKSED